jgi:hypothetical protein
MNRAVRTASVVAAAVLQLTVAVLVGAGSAHASVGPADDRQLNSPTGW